MDRKAWCSGDLKNLLEESHCPGGHQGCEVGRNQMESKKNSALQELPEKWEAILPKRQAARRGNLWYGFFEKAVRTETEVHDGGLKLVCEGSVLCELGQ